MVASKVDSKEPGILIIEDDPTFLRVWERILKSAKIKNYWLTSDPEQAKSILKNTIISLLICDVLIPKISGYEMAKFARQLQPNIGVLLTTAYNCNLSRFQLEESKFHLLHKPFNSISKIQQLVIHLAKGENVFLDADEATFTENEDYPSVTEWTL
jgi:DNA-binding NtrC family response regulator